MNMYGPYQHPEKLIGKIIAHCLTDKHFTLYEGGSVRGWTFVKDTCDALYHLSNDAKVGEIYHIPPNSYKTVPEVAETILRFTGKEYLQYKASKDNSEQHASEEPGGTCLFSGLLYHCRGLSVLI